MPLPRFLSHNFAWKVISFAAAIPVWMAIKSGTPARLQPSESRTWKRIPITVMTAANDQRVFRVDPDTVDVRVSGAPELMDRLRSSDIHVFVDLTPVIEAQELRLEVEVYTPPGCSLVRVSPPEVRIQSLPLPPPASNRSF